MKTKTKIFLVVGAVALLALIIVANLKFAQKSTIKVEAQKVQERELRAVVSASGKIRAKTSVDLSANTTGKVVTLAVDEGDRVVKGQALLRIDPTPAETQVNRFKRACKRRGRRMICSARIWNKRRWKPTARKHFMKGS